MEVLDMEEEERRRRMLWPEGEHLLFKPGVPSLADLCLDYVADCFQQLEGLGTWLLALSVLGVGASHRPPMVCVECQQTDYR
jgi:hypothetical protein